MSKTYEEQLEEDWQKLFNQYLGVAQDTLSENTAQSRRSCLSQWMSWLQEEGIHPGDAEEHHVRRFLDINLHKSDSMIGSLLSAISVFYMWAVNRAICEQNPAEGISLEEDPEYGTIDPNTPQKVKILQDRGDTDEAIYALSPEHVQALFEHPGKPAIRNELISRLLYQTGVRTIELSRVKLEDINYGQRKIRIRSAKSEPGETNYIRYVWYHQNLDFLMREWVENQRVSYATAKESDYLLLTHQKEQMRPSYISRIVKQQAKDAEINEVIDVDAAGKNRWLVTGHVLRHTMASHAANGTHPADESGDGIPIHMLAKVLGHRKISTTMQYVSTDWDQIEDVVKERGPRVG